VFRRIGKEEDVSIYEADVVCSTDAGHFINWKRDGLLTPYVPEDVAKHFPPEQIDSDGMYATVFALLSPISYNTNLVRPEDAPKSFADLLDPNGGAKSSKAARTIAARF
jgi:iron(III) transport system substrate-binding protein